MVWWRRVCLCIVWALFLVGCANRPAPIPLPGVDAYSRNEIVCLPTGIGNAVCGLPGWILLTPFGFLCSANEGFCQRESVLVGGAVVSAVLIQTPAYLCGAATGTLFVPLSYLSKEDPCSFM